MNALATPARTGSAGALRWLADAYARYAHLVLDQLQALEDGDLDRVATLASERDKLAGEIDGRDPIPGPDEPGAVGLRAEVGLSLTRAADADRLFRRRLRELRTEARGSIDDAARAAERTADVGRSYAPPSAPGGRLDVSF